jgi:hypothetical protein
MKSVMGKEPRDGGADVEAVYARGKSGNYPNPYLTPQDLRDLLDRCQGGGKLICNIEAYEIDGEFDKPRIDLGFYAGGVSEQMRQWDERVAEAAEFVESLLDDVAEEPNPIMFIVWLDARASA